MPERLPAVEALLGVEVALPEDGRIQVADFDALSAPVVPLS
jgi:hypothetical protein